jgi:hypothetical protein
MKLSALTRSTRLVAASAVVLATLASLSATAEAASAGAPTTSSVLTSAKSAIGKQTSVHLVLTSKSSSTAAEEHIKADLEKTSGIETISVGGETAVIKVTPSYAYLSGNSSGLTTLFGLTSAEVSKVGTDWVTFKAGTSQYKDLAASLTVSSVSSVLPAAKGTKLHAPAPSTKKLYTLKWETAATSSEPALANTLTLSAIGATLPVQETSTASGGGKETLALSKWGEHVLVSAPAAGSTIPFSKVSG